LTLEIYGEEQFFKLTALLEYISQAYVKHGAFVGNAVNVFICAHNRWVIIPDRQIYALICIFAPEIKQTDDYRGYNIRLHAGQPGH
jgi:hypothetical protein